eukprot:TRINITY_DN1461_c0_g1_i3.p1 TRINITY_DN1461_c0_g1~~TRINITY_DN1461_c0_g1_i3.p1  ORF type:complete len:335 (-),score=77.08 TRINITY_DN1461_c0_g1_i3:73-1077(-)
MSNKKERDAFILLSGKELEEIKQAERTGKSLTNSQREFVKQNGVTLNRKLLDAFHSLSRLKSVEQWICLVLSLDPIQQFPDSILWASSSFSIQSSSSSLSTLPFLLDSTFFQCSSSIDDFQKWIESGVLLCNLLNVIRPGQIKTIYLAEKDKPLSKFKSRENVHFFLDGCRNLGSFRKGYEFFDIEDLIENKNISRVIETITYLAKNSKSINSKLPEWEEIKFNQLAFNVNSESMETTERSFDNVNNETAITNNEFGPVTSLRSSSPSLSSVSSPLQSLRHQDDTLSERKDLTSKLSPSQKRRETNSFDGNNIMDPGPSRITAAAGTGLAGAFL